MSGFSHRALLYGSRDEFVTVAGRHLRAGAEAGDSVIAVTTRANVRALREELGDLAETVRFESSEDWYQPQRPGGPCGSTALALTHPGDAHVRVLGEQMWLAPLGRGTPRMAAIRSIREHHLPLTAHPGGLHIRRQ